MSTSEILAATESSVEAPAKAPVATPAATTSSSAPAKEPAATAASASESTDAALPVTPASVEEARRIYLGNLPRKVNAEDVTSFLKGYTV